MRGLGVGFEKPVNREVLSLTGDRTRLIVELQNERNGSGGKTLAPGTIITDVTINDTICH